MKTSALLIVLAALPFLTLPCYGEDAHDNKEKIRLIKRGRPSLPSSTYIDIYIGESEIILDLPENVEYMTVELKQGDVVVLTGMVDHEDASIDVAGLQGEYEILCRTDGNQLFAGNIEL